MLDDYAMTQPLAYKLLKNTIKKNRCSHAYIIETNGTLDALDFSISFSKYLFCPYNYTNKNVCGDCNICHQIEIGSYFELKIINPEGLWIKKEQIKDLEEEFKKKSLLGNKKIYIINHADQMNVAASNTLLKFLEEPEENIIAILIVDNIYNLLPTIISRCQIIPLKSNQILENSVLGNISQEEMGLKIDCCVKFVSYLEKYKAETICKINSLWMKNFKDKENLIQGLTIMIDFYKAILDYKLSITNENFKSYSDLINLIEKNNTINNICDKIDIIFKAREKVKFNANAALLMDKLIIDLERIK